MTAAPQPQPTERRPPATTRPTRDRRHLTLVRPDRPAYIAFYLPMLARNGDTVLQLDLKRPHRCRLTFSWDTQGDHAGVLYEPSHRDTGARLALLRDAQAQCRYQLLKSAGTTHARLWRRAVTVVELEIERAERRRASLPVQEQAEMAALGAIMEQGRPAYEAAVAAYLAQPSALEQGRAAYDAALATYRAASEAGL